MQSVFFKKIKSFLLHVSDVVNKQDNLIINFNETEVKKLYKSRMILKVLVNIKLNVILDLFDLEKIKQSVLKNEKKSMKFKLIFDKEILNIKMILLIIKIY